jgi:hypothetical protein
MLTVSQQTRDHKLGTIADSVDGRVLDDDTLVGGEQRLERADDLAEVALIALVVVEVLGVENVVQSDEVLLLVHSTRSHTSKLLHVSADAEQQTEVDTESTDVGTGLARNPKDTELSLIVKLVKVALVDGSDTELSLDGRDERRALEQGTSEGLEGASELLLAAGELAVQSDDTNILLTSTLLRLDQTSGAINADNQTSSDFGIEGAGVASTLTTQDALDPGDDFVRGGVGGLVEVDDTAGDVRLEITLEGSCARGDGSKVSSANKDCAQAS